MVDEEQFYDVLANEIRKFGPSLVVCACGDVQHYLSEATLYPEPADVEEIYLKSIRR